MFSYFSIGPDEEFEVKHRGSVFSICYYPCQFIEEVKDSSVVSASKVLPFLLPSLYLGAHVIVSNMLGIGISWDWAFFMGIILFIVSGIGVMVFKEKKTFKHKIDLYWGDKEGGENGQENREAIQFALKHENYPAVLDILHEISLCDTVYQKELLSVLWESIYNYADTVKEELEIQKAKDNEMRELVSTSDTESRIDGAKVLLSESEMLKESAMLMRQAYDELR